MEQIPYSECILTFENCLETFPLVALSPCSKDPSFAFWQGLCSVRSEGVCSWPRSNLTTATPVTTHGGRSRQSPGK